MKTLLCGMVICIVCNAVPQDDQDYLFDDIFGETTEATVDYDDNEEVFDKIFDEITEATEDEVNYAVDIDDELFPNEPDCINLNEANKDIVFKNREVTEDCNKTAKCSYYANQDFKCAPYYQCQNKERSPILTSGTGTTNFNLIDLRNIDVNLCVKLEGTLDASDIKCDREGDVCCKNPDTNVQICKAVPEDVFQECGRTSNKTTITNLDQKVTGSAQPGEFTHMCVIYRITPEGDTVYHAGASLIANNKVITVAHKFWVTRKKSPSKSVDYRNSVSDFKVRCGEYNVRKEKELIKHQETDVAAMYFHPLYDPTHKFVLHNLVILRTEDNFIYQNHIGPVCLPSPTDNFESDEECYSSGWGQKQFKATDSYSDILKKIDMSIIPRNQCNSRMKRRLPNFKAHKSLVCVGGERGKDTCTGDGGSPHVCKRDGKWIQVGAVAWGIKCGLGLPSIYASIPDAMCWIDQIMTCVPLAQTDVNDDEDIIDIRDSGDVEKPSINNLNADDCKNWDEHVPDIGNCQVTYNEDNEDYYDYEIRGEDINK